MDRLIRWNPRREVADWGRTEEDAWLTRPWLEQELWGPAVDMYETENQVVVKAALPGIKPEDIDVKIVGNSLSIKGEVKQEQEHKGRQYIRRERRYGSFSRTLSIPDVDADKVKAEFENGVLTLQLPKPESAKPRVIEVKSK